jgi:RNA polymerase sigma-70 factor (ECF subfamily)
MENTQRSESGEFKLAVLRSYPDLLKRAKHLTRTPWEAQDLVQDTIERGLRNRDSFQYGTEPNRWLGTILKRLFVDHYRSARRWRFEGCVADLPAPAAPDDAQDDAPWQDVDLGDVRRALDSLGSPFREVYSLHALDRLSYREISARLEIPIGTVGTRVHRARHKLRRILERKCPRGH